MQPYIYKITNIINNKIYVGKSNGNLKYYFTGGKMIKRAIKKYGKSNFKKEIIVEGDFNLELLNQLEKHYIRLYSPPESTNSYNITYGGNGSLGLKHTDDSKVKISQSSKTSSNRESHINMITNLRYWKGKKRCQSTNLKIAKGNSKVIYQYDLEGNFIREWESATQASKYYNLKTSSPISSSANLRNRKKTSCGFIWKFNKE